MEGIEFDTFMTAAKSTKGPETKAKAGKGTFGPVGGKGGKATSNPTAKLTSTSSAKPSNLATTSTSKPTAAGPTASPSKSLMTSKPTTCMGVGATCTTQSASSSECCSGLCSQQLNCICFATGGFFTCTFNAQCCSGKCGVNQQCE
jgi:hypothetical protein